MRAVGIFAVVFVLFCFSSTLVLGGPNHSVNPDNFTTTEAEILNDPAFRSFLTTVVRLKACHVKRKELSNISLMKSAINGMIAGLGDKYSQFIPKENQTAYVEERAGNNNNSVVSSKVVSCPAGYNVSVIKISIIKEVAALQFDVAVRKTMALGCRGIILDLRNCPGGSAGATDDILSNFLGVDKITMSRVLGSGKRETARTLDSKYRTKLRAVRPLGWEKVASLPVVCLVNDRSASASEVMALALREGRHVPIVGKRTFGKGIGQDYIDVGVLGWVKTTLYSWYSPSGTSIHKTGVLPDFEEDDHKGQMDKALSLFK